MAARRRAFEHMPTEYILLESRVPSRHRCKRVLGARELNNPLLDEGPHACEHMDLCRICLSRDISGDMIDSLSDLFRQLLDISQLCTLAAF